MSGQFLNMSKQLWQLSQINWEGYVVGFVSASNYFKSKLQIFMEDLMLLGPGQRKE